MTAPYQKHSETSREAAETANTENLREKVFFQLGCFGKGGATVDRISQILNTPAGTISARMIELERSGHVIKTAMKSKTRYNKQAFVYVIASEWTDEAGRAPIKQKMVSIPFQDLDKICDVLGALWVVEDHKLDNLEREAVRNAFALYRQIRENYLT